MATIDTTHSGQRVHSAYGDGDNYLTHSRGILSWLTTLDHKRIGIMYLCCILGAFFVGGVFALLVRTELLTPTQTIMDAERYNRAFTMHGAIMVFLFIIPGIPAALGNVVLPLMIGAKDVAFPRLNLMSWYLWVIGTAVLLLSLVNGGLDTGWTFYTPYSTSTTNAVIPATLGVFIIGFSSILTGLNFIVTIHTLRVPGLGWFDLPLFLWGIYATAVIQILATPVLAITLLLLCIEKFLGIGIFDPALGGDPVLFQHFFWFYSHPAVYIMILPGMAVISELIPTFARKKIFGYRFIGYSSIAIALFGFIVWGHHMFVSGQSRLVTMIFSALTFSVAIPSAVKIFNWLATLYKGSIQYTTPMWYALSFMFLFAIGGLTGIHCATLSTDVHLHDTYFVVAHFHYVMVGGTVIGFLGGLHYWWPKMFGRMYNERLGRLGCLLVFWGFNQTFFTQFIMGMRGMPRRYFNYLEEFRTLHQVSTLGSYIMGAGLLLTAIYLTHSLYRGRKAPANPWGANTLEWHTASPPPHHNFDDVPAAVQPYDYSDWNWDVSIGGYVKKQGA
jgi:cytochrome c oxidase subunit 1